MSGEKKIAGLPLRRPVLISCTPPYKSRQVLNLKLSKSSSGIRAVPNSP
jgi:hypothetical protein